MGRGRSDDGEGRGEKPVKRVSFSEMFRKPPVKEDLSHLPDEDLPYDLDDLDSGPWKKGAGDRTEH